MLASNWICSCKHHHWTQHFMLHTGKIDIFEMASYSCKKLHSMLIKYVFSECGIFNCYEMTICSCKSCKAGDKASKAFYSMMHFSSHIFISTLTSIFLHSIKFWYLSNSFPRMFSHTYISAIYKQRGVTKRMEMFSLKETFTWEYFCVILAAFCWFNMFTAI